MRAFDANAYLNIPYKAGGRDRNGLDCWGLARLVYADEFDIILPGHDDATIEQADGPGLADYMAAHMEGWQRVEKPEPGDLIRLRSKGEDYHVGVATGGDWFIHARNGHTSTQERLTSIHWARRIEGFYRYAPKQKGVSISGRPHPLKMRRIEGAAQAGQTLADAVGAHCVGIRPELVKRGIAFINGKRVPFEQWPQTILAEGDAVEFRMLPGDDERSFLMLIVAVVAAAATSGASAAWSGSSYAAAYPAISPNFIGGLAGLAVTVAGSMLVNHIAPLPEAEELSTPKPAWQLAGGPNQAVPYGAFPVVLGQHRFTPPLGAQNYMTTNGSDRFLHLIVVWGYDCDVSDLKIGDTPLTDFEDVDVRHLTGSASEYVDGALDRTRPDVAAFLDCYGRATAQQQPQVKLEADYISRTTEQKNITRVDVVLSFPGGLVEFDQDTGKAKPIDVEVAVEYRRLGYWNAAGVWVDDVGAWSVGATTVNGLPATQISEYPNWQDPPQEYARTIIGLRNGNQLFVKNSGASYVGDTVTPSTWPLLAPNEIPIYRIEGHTLESTLNTDKFTGLALSITSRTATYGTGDASYTTIQWLVSVGAGVVDQTFWFNGADHNPFDKVLSFDFNAAAGQYEFRARRATAVRSSTRISDAVYWLALTEFAQNELPINPPKPMAMSAIRIRASNQINGTLDGISGLVRSRQLVWDGATWRAPAADDARNNPASLVRHVLQHPGSAKPVDTANIDLAALEHFSEWCAAKGFTYENVITGQRPIREVLREIAAAGRASITQPDGIWSVVIDEPKTRIGMHLTPHNSWGFKGRLLLPEIPHGLRVQFLNRDKDYQPDEITVYADGYNAANATLIETISLPGSTWAGTAIAPGPVYKLARFHMEQMLLRREEYELYSDHESVICTRGDRVEVAHDVPMWGLGSGRIKSVTIDGSSHATAVVLDEAVTMAAGKNYALRWRTAANEDAWASVVTEAGMVEALTFLLPVTGLQPAAGDLFMFGEADRMTASLLVKSVEQMPNLQARVVMYDYAPAVFDAENAPFGTWSSQVTLPPPLARTQIKQVPIIESVAADEFALTRSGSGYQANILIRWRTDVAMGTTAERMSDQAYQVEVQYRLAGSLSNNTPWKPFATPAVKSGTVTVGPLSEGLTYDVRLRFVGETGRVGVWLTQSNILVTGKSNDPEPVTGLRASFADTALTIATVTLDWDDSLAQDVVGYVVSRPGREVFVQASTFTELAEWTGTRSYTVRARDSGGRLSAPVTLSIDKRAPASPVNFRASVVDNNVLFYWLAPPLTTLPISAYELREGDTWASGAVRARAVNGFTTFETSGGLKQYWLATIDTDGQYSDPVSLSVNVDQPPDYVLRLDHDTTFSGTYSNAIFEHGAVIFPVNTTETVDEHYTTRIWTSRQDQIDAGFPIYAQPAPAQGYYEDVIDLGAVVKSSRVTIASTVEVVAGAPTITPMISSRLNVGDAWVDHTGDQVYLTNFRYIKARVTAESSGDDLARLTGMNVRLDIKTKSRSFKVDCLASDVGGTILYLTDDGTAAGEPLFIDVSAIHPTPFASETQTAYFSFVDTPYQTVVGLFIVNKATGVRENGTVGVTVEGV